MDKAFDQASIKLTLRDGLAKGYWTIENLDRPSAGWAANENVWLRHPLNVAKTHRPHDNLLREPQEDISNDDDFYAAL